MTIWVVRAGSKSLYEEEVLEKGIATIDFSFEESLKGLSIDEIKEKVKKYSPDIKQGAVGGRAGMLFKLANKIQLGDWVLFPARFRSSYHLGKVIGLYQYKAEGFINSDGDCLRHAVSVAWDPDIEISKSSVPGDIRNSLGSTLSLFCLKDDQKVRFLEIIKRTSENSIQESFYVDSRLQQNEEENWQDSLVSEENLLEKISNHIKDNFKEHRLTDLITCLLEASGFTCFQSPPGPDGGVDIIAGQGSLGLQQPRICVQVKSGAHIVKAIEVSQLDEVMNRFGADSSLFVSWSGFNKEVAKTIKSRFLRMRFWTDADIVEQVLRHYDRLPLEIKKAIPLKQCWLLVEDT